MTADQLRAAIEAHNPEENGVQWYVDEYVIDCDTDEFWAVIARALAGESRKEGEVAAPVASLTPEEFEDEHMDLTAALPDTSTRPLDEPADLEDERILHRLTGPGTTVSAFNSSI